MTEEWDAQKPFIKTLETDGYTKGSDYWSRTVTDGIEHQVRIVDLSDRGPIYLVRQHRLGYGPWCKIKHTLFFAAPSGGIGVRPAGKSFQFFRFQDLT